MTVYTYQNYKLIDGNGDGYFRLNDVEDFIQDEFGNDVSTSQFLKEFSEFPEELRFLQDGQSLDSTEKVSMAFAPGFVRTTNPTQATRMMRPGAGWVGALLAAGAVGLAYVFGRDSELEPTPDLQVYVEGEGGAWVSFPKPNMFPGADDQEVVEEGVDAGDANSFVIYASGDDEFNELHEAIESGDQDAVNETVRKFIEECRDMDPEKGEAHAKDAVHFLIDKGTSMFSDDIPASELALVKTILEAADEIKNWIKSDRDRYNRNFVFFHGTGQVLQEYGARIAIAEMKLGAVPQAISGDGGDAVEGDDDAPESTDWTSEEAEEMVREGRWEDAADLYAENGNHTRAKELYLQVLEGWQAGAEDVSRATKDLVIHLTGGAVQGRDTAHEYYTGNKAILNFKLAREELALGNLDEAARHLAAFEKHMGLFDEHGSDPVFTDTLVPLDWIDAREVAEVTIAIAERHLETGHPIHAIRSGRRLMQAARCLKDIEEYETAIHCVQMALEAFTLANDWDRAREVGALLLELNELYTYTGRADNQIEQLVLLRDMAIAHENYRKALRLTVEIHGRYEFDDDHNAAARQRLIQANLHQLLGNVDIAVRIFTQVFNYYYDLGEREEAEAIFSRTMDLIAEQPDEGFRNEMHLLVLQTVMESVTPITWGTSERIENNNIQEAVDRLQIGLTLLRRMRAYFYYEDLVEMREIDWEAEVAPGVDDDLRQVEMNRRTYQALQDMAEGLDAAAEWYDDFDFDPRIQNPDSDQIRGNEQDYAELLESEIKSFMSRLEQELEDR